MIFIIIVPGHPLYVQGSERLDSRQAPDVSVPACGAGVRPRPQLGASEEGLSWK